MNERKQIITLFSSESTARYIKDVFSVLALPRGSVFQFRYDTQYIDPRLLTMFSQGYTENLLFFEVPRMCGKKIVF